MRRFLIIPALLLVGFNSFAGNDVKRGQAGQTELQFNGWARSSGWGNANTGGVRGVESFALNIAGLAYLQGTQLTYATSRYLVGSDIQVNNIGFGTQVSETGVLGIYISSWNLGEFLETTADRPDGTGNTFKPTLFNFGIAYSKIFSKTITGGIVVKGINQSIPNVSAFGICLDAGVQYKGGSHDQFKFGVALRNIGPKLQFRGDGLTYRGTDPGRRYPLTASVLSGQYEMPAMLNIGAGYDFTIDEQSRITAVGNFNSNSFTKDQFQGGAEYAWKEMVMIRAGLDYSAGMFNPENRTNAYTGPTFGLTFQVPFKFNKAGEAVQDPDAEIDSTPTPNKKDRQKMFALDYSYRTSNPWAGTHTISLTLNL